MYWEINVAIATPATSSFNTITKNKFKQILITPAIAKKIKGTFVLPLAL